MEYCYLNGKVIKTKDAKIDIYDIGFLRGYAVFDYIKAYDGKPFLLPEHLDRLDHSAERFGMKVPLSHKKITEIVGILIKKNKAGTCAIRIMLTGGKAAGLEGDKNNPTFAVLIEPALPLPESLYKKGGALITAEFNRSPWDAKHTNYSFAVSKQDSRKKAKAVEILYTWKGEVKEATTSNIFIVKGGKIFTPKEGVLFGMTRNYVIDLAKRDYLVQQRKIMLKELLSADECFITATNKEVLPIFKIDGKMIGNGKVGPISRSIMQSFNDAVTNHSKI